jgi:hypothetical protein
VTRAKYWQVLTQEQGQEQEGAVAVAVPRMDKTTARLLEEIEEQECFRLELLAQDHLAADVEVEEADETTPWLNVTEWPKQFAQRPLNLISQYGLQPAAVAVAGEDAHFGSFQEIELFSSASDETRLRQIVWIFSLVYTRCQATLAETPYNYTVLAQEL